MTTFEEYHFQRGMGRQTCARDESLLLESDCNRSDLCRSGVQATVETQAAVKKFRCCHQRFCA